MTWRVGVVRQASSAPRTLPELHRQVMDQKSLAYFEGGALEMMMQIFSSLAWNADLAASAETSLLELQDSLLVRRSDACDGTSHIPYVDAGSCQVDDYVI